MQGIPKTYTQFNCNKREAREETRNKNKKWRKPIWYTLPVILSLVSKLEAFYFSDLKPDINIPLWLNVDMDYRLHSCLKGAK